MFKFIESLRYFNPSIFLTKLKSTKLNRSKSPISFIINTRFSMQNNVFID